MYKIFKRNQWNKKYDDRNEMDEGVRQTNTKAKRTPILWHQI